MVDTNVRRVLSRVFDVEPAQVEAFAAGVVPNTDAYRWNQALMDLGATLCRTSKPLCLVCPLVTECAGPFRSHTRHRRSVSEPFEGSRRALRGRIIDALRRLAPGERIAVSALSNDAEVVAALADEGLIEIDSGAFVRLAD